MQPLLSPAYIDVSYESAPTRFANLEGNMSMPEIHATHCQGGGVCSEAGIDSTHRLFPIQRLPVIQRGWKQFGTLILLTY